MNEFNKITFIQWYNWQVQDLAELMYVCIWAIQGCQFDQFYLSSLLVCFPLQDLHVNTDFALTVVLVA